MIFSKKTKKEKCDNCNSNIDKNYSFCPYCGDNLLDPIKEARNYGLLGKNDNIDNLQPQLNFGIADRLIGSLVNSLVKTLDKQFKNYDKEVTKFEKSEIQSFPNGIKIKIGAPIPIKKPQAKSFFKKLPSDQQLEKIISLPKETAETKIKRLGDKIIYELATPGISSHNDIFISKLESGYEIKAIGNKKIYVNTLPVNLPIKSLAIDNNKLFVEFIVDPTFNF